MKKVICYDDDDASPRWRPELKYPATLNLCNDIFTKKEQKGDGWYNDALYYSMSNSNIAIVMDDVFDLLPITKEGFSIYDHVDAQYRSDRPKHISF